MVTKFRDDEDLDDLDIDPAGGEDDENEEDAPVVVRKKKAKPAAEAKAKPKAAKAKAKAKDEDEEEAPVKKAKAKSNGKAPKERKRREVEPRDIPFVPDSTLGQAFTLAQKGTSTEKLEGFLKKKGVKPYWVMSCLRRGHCYGATWRADEEGGLFKIRALKMPKQLDPYSY